ncbi:MAG: class I SAM-dependent methyltransferase [Chloroflexi bacterium]|nr:class I SAM-dependent methyltransferase [Chloroflexota bacterium]
MIYKDYAAVYDASGQISFSEQMIPYLGRVLARHPVPRGRLLDLACGTGTVAIAMALQGWEVTGLDGSEAMLTEAREKARALGDALPSGALLWRHGDMRHFRLDTPVDLATCLYDSLNYMLTDQDLLATFRRVHAALRPGGLFFADMNTAYALETYWADQTYVTDSPELTVIMDSDHDQAIHRTTVTVTCFQRTGDLYRKIQETHLEQAYPNEHVATLLSDAGFRVEASYACFSERPPDEYTTRVFWVARKPGAPVHAEEPGR